MATKSLNGAEIADFIKERQAKTVRMLRQAHHIYPKLAIVLPAGNLVIEKYVGLKKKYGADILIDVEPHFVDATNITETLKNLNEDESVHGIIVQLPLFEGADTTEILNGVDSEKDVDGLGGSGKFKPATPTAIIWLLNGYDIKLEGKEILIIGQGRLVGAPLYAMLAGDDLNLKTIDVDTPNPGELIAAADVIVSAAGSPGLLTPEMLKHGAVVVDAGTTSENGRIVGDLDEDCYQREDLILTPKIGGVGPLTIAALFENLLIAAQAKIKN